MRPDASSAASVLPASTQLSHYRLVDRIGAGGMGVVYRAVDTRLDRFVALKVIGQVSDEDRRQRFVKEARAAAAFNHPNIVTIYEVDEQDGTDFIVMELLSGESLDRRVRPGGLPLDEVLGYGEQMAGAFEAAHAAGIVHRDIKPANVMVTESGQVKVLDFGVAKLMALGEPDATTMAVKDATGPGAVLGSLGYMSPEQAQGHIVSAKSDVFSFGVVLHELLTGNRPANSPFPPPAPRGTGSASDTASRRSLPAPLLALIGECLSLDQSQRPDMRDIRRRLGAMRQKGGGRLDLLRRPAVSGALLAVVLAIGAGGLYWWSSGREVRAARARMPEILALAEKHDVDGFYRAARPVLPLLPDDLHLRNLWINGTMKASFDSLPTGAEVWVKGYTATDREWIRIGTTPLKDERVPFGPNRLRLVKAGFDTVEAPLNPFDAIYPLDRRRLAARGNASGVQDQRRAAGGAARAPRFLDRQVRGHQPPVQDVRRCGRLPPRGLVDAAVRR